MLKLFGEKRFVYSVKVFPLSIKSINPIQKHPHIIESYACIMKIFVLMFLFCKAEEEGWLMNALISFGIYSTPELSKQVILLLLFTHKATQWVPISEYS